MNTMKKIDPKLFGNLYLIRHGESTANTFNRLAGKIDVPLTSLGKNQAYEGSKKCKGLIFDKVYVSPLQRAHETAKIMLHEHLKSNNTFSIDKRLEERDFGSFTLNNKSILQKTHGIRKYEKAVNLDSDVMKDGESYNDFSKRVYDFFDNEIIPSLKEGKQIVIVSHKYVIELFCNIILNRSIKKNYDLRLPNAEILRADKIAQHTKHENEKSNIFKDWLIINHYWIFFISMLCGLSLNYLGLNIEVHFGILLFILVLATNITMARLNTEDSNKHILNKTNILIIFYRYLLLPFFFILFFYFSDFMINDLIKVIILFLCTPTAIIAITVSKSIGGFISPTFSYTFLSSLISIVPFCLTLNLFFNKDILFISILCILLFTISVLIPYLFILLVRQKKPIKTAKIGERQSYISVILISFFILLVSLDLKATSIDNLILVFFLAIALRILARIFASSNKINALDIYISMSYPNVFLIVLISKMINLPLLEEIATLFLIPMFLLSIFDIWYSKKFYIQAKDEKLLQVLSISSIPPRL